MANDKVTAYLAQLIHPRKDEIERLRSAILAADNAISEQVKWNAPSFCWKGEDRVTMRLHPGDRLQLIFHRGTKPKNVEGFEFFDPTGRLEWPAKDRAVFTVQNADDLDHSLMAITDLAHRWMVATA